jgi:hypothetical protein
MPETFDTLIARAQAARARARQLREQLNSPSAREAHATADEHWRIMRQLVEEGRKLQKASKARRRQQAS